MTNMSKRHSPENFGDERLAKNKKRNLVFVLNALAHQHPPNAE